MLFYPLLFRICTLNIIYYSEKVVINLRLLEYQLLIIRSPECSVDEVGFQLVNLILFEPHLKEFYWNFGVAKFENLERWTKS